LSDVPPPKPLHVEPAQNDIQDFLKNFRRNLGPFWLILSTVLLAYGIWYRQTRFDIGFCTEAESETPTQKGKQQLFSSHWTTNVLMWNAF